MIRLAMFVTVIAGGLYLAAFYKLGDKPLAGHLNDIYRSPVVQEKLHDLTIGVDKRVHHLEHDAEKVLPKKTESHVRRQTAQNEPVESEERHASAPIEAEHRAAVDHVAVERPAAMHAERPQPAHDKLTDDDRASLDHLLAKKLSK